MKAEEMEALLIKIYKELKNKVPQCSKQTEYWAGVLDAFEYIKTRIREELKNEKLSD